MFRWLKEYRKYRDAKSVWEKMKGLCDWQHLDGCANSDNPTTIRCAGEGLKGKLGRCEMLHCPMLRDD